MTPVAAPPFFPDAPPPRKRWTRDECAQMATLFDLSRYELIEGELIQKMSKGHPHSIYIMLAVDWLRARFPLRTVAQEISIDVRPEDNPTSEPEPDIVVLRCDFRDLAPRPKSSDILMLIEVADSTLSLDLGAKRDLYARAGIPDYWVLDANRRQIWVHRDPADGVYRSVTLAGEHDAIRPLAAPEAEFALDRLA